MTIEPAHVHFTAKEAEVKQSPAETDKLLLMLVLAAATGLPASDVDVVKEKILKDGIKVYVTGTVDADIHTALRLALLRAENERDQYRTRAEHFEGELQKAKAANEELEKELTVKRKTLSFLEQIPDRPRWPS